MLRLRADADAVAEALGLDFYAVPARRSLDIRRHLLRPVPRHAATDREDAEPRSARDELRVVLQIEERIEAHRRPPAPAARAVEEREVEADLRVGERRHVDRHATAPGGAQHAAHRLALPRLCRRRRTLAFAQPPPERLVQGARAGDLAFRPLLQDRLDDELHPIQVALQFQRVVDAVETRVVRGAVVERAGARRRLEVDHPGGLDEAMDHQGPGADDRVEQSVVDHVAQNEPLLGRGHRAGEGADDQAVRIRGHVVEHVRRLAKLTAPEGGRLHRREQIREGPDGAEIERFEGFQPAAFRELGRAARAAGGMGGSIAHELRTEAIAARTPAMTGFAPKATKVRRQRRETPAAILKLAPYQLGSGFRHR